MYCSASYSLALGASGGTEEQDGIENNREEEKGEERVRESRRSFPRRFWACYFLLLLCCYCVFLKIIGGHMFEIPHLRFVSGGKETLGVLTFFFCTRWGSFYLRLGSFRLWEGVLIGAEGWKE